MTFRITCLNNDSVGMDSGMWGEHGISYLIEKGNQRILFDTGTSWEILDHNLKKKKMTLDNVSHVVLSHGHYDHTGGLLWVLSQLKMPTLVADPIIFNQKYSDRGEGKELVEIGIPFTREQIEEKANLLRSAEPVEIMESVIVTGRIPRITSFEKAPQSMLVEIDGEKQPDTILDDRSIVLQTEKGLVLLTGCCHAGIINTLFEIRSRFGKPVYAITGGIHLVGASEERVQKTIEALRDEYKQAEMYFNHCTGLDAIIALTNAFGKQVKPCYAGTILEF